MSDHTAGRAGPEASERNRRARFEAVFDETHLPLLSYAVRRVADPADAADIVAEAFLVAWRRIDEVPEGADARPGCSAWPTAACRTTTAGNVP